MSGSDSAIPRRRLAIVTCMDCRIDPLAAAELELGEAHVIRNAGGLITADARRSLALSQHALGTNEVWVVMHTGCGLLGLDDREFLDRVEAEVGARPEWEPGGFDSLERTVRAGVEAVRSDPVLAAELVRGFILDIEDGRLTELD